MEADKKEFACLRCGHNSTTKQNLIKHLNNKEPCDVKKGLRNISIEEYLKSLQKQVNDNAVVCKFCGTMFNQRRYLTCHFNVCKHNPQSDKFVGSQPVQLQNDKQKIAMLHDELMRCKALLKEKDKQIVELQTRLTNEDFETGGEKIIKPIQLIIQIQKEPVKKQKIPSRLRNVVWNTYIGDNIGKSLCMCCKDNYITCFKFHCGHVIAECEGGETTLENLRPICDDCNQSMQIMNMAEFSYKYFRNVIK
jgi:transcription elongation factor Elf1